MWKFLVLTSEQDIACIEVAERGFIFKAAFPKEGSYIFLDNLQFICCTKIYHKDLSFENFDEMISVAEENEVKDFMIYDTFRLSTLSDYKLTTALSNEHTKQI